MQGKAFLVLCVMFLFLLRKRLKNVSQMLVGASWHCVSFGWFPIRYAMSFLFFFFDAHMLFGFLYRPFDSKWSTSIMPSTKLRVLRVDVYGLNWLTLFDSLLSSVERSSSRIGSKWRSREAEGWLAPAISDPQCLPSLLCSLPLFHRLSLLFLVLLFPLSHSLYPPPYQSSCPLSSSPCLSLPPR